MLQILIMSKKYKYGFEQTCPHCESPFWGRPKVSTSVGDNHKLGKKYDEEDIINFSVIIKRYRCKICKNYWEVVYYPIRRYALRSITVGDNKGIGIALDSIEQLKHSY